MNMLSAINCRVVPPNILPSAAAISTVVSANGTRQRENGASSAADFSAGMPRVAQEPEEPDRKLRDHVYDRGRRDESGHDVHHVASSGRRTPEPPPDDIQTRSGWWSGISTDCPVRPSGKSSSTAPTGPRTWRSPPAMIASAPYRYAFEPESPSRTRAPTVIAAPEIMTIQPSIMTLRKG